MSSPLPYIIRKLAFLLSLSVLLPAMARANTPADSTEWLRTHHYTVGTNLRVAADSVKLTCLPLKDCYVWVRRGETVAVAEWTVNSEQAGTNGEQLTTDSMQTVDSIWVKLARTQQAQGWVSEREMMGDFVPVGDLSFLVRSYVWSGRRPWVGIGALVVALLSGYWLRRRGLWDECFNVVGRVYPLFLMLCVAILAAICQGLLRYAPDLMTHFHFNPSLSLGGQPAGIVALLIAFWASTVALLAVADQALRAHGPWVGMWKLLTVVAASVVCHYAVVYTISIFVGYLIPLALAGELARQVRKDLRQLAMSR